MQDTPQLSEAKRALLEKYLRGELPQTTRAEGTAPRDKGENASSSSSADSRFSINPIQTAGSKRPFFYSHVHWQGSAFYCFTLAHDLGPDQPFYVLEPFNFEGLSVLPSLEAMATAYVEAIRTVQPEGPYQLGGFCGGGLIALEMAQQLLALGEAVDLLVLIEAVDGPTFSYKMLFRRLVCGFVRRIGNLIQLGQDKQLDWFLRLRHVYLLLRYSQYRKSQNFLRFPTTEVLRQDYIGIFVWIISQYIPRQYPGLLTHFWARKGKHGSRGAEKGEAAEAKEIETYIISGNHTSCRNEDIHDMAQYLSMCLNKVQATSLS